MKRIIVQVMQILLAIMGLVLLAPIIPIYLVMDFFYENDGEKKHEKGL